MEVQMRKLLLLLIILVLQCSSNAQTNQSQITLGASAIRYKINRNIYGQFSEDLGHCIYGGIWVGTKSSIPNIDGIRKDVVVALRRIKVPVLRWPGGCFADGYHWKDGIGPRSKRPKTINTDWGGVTDDNAFGTAEFLEFCKLIGCQPYFTGNLGSGTVKELSQWVEYVNSDQPSYITNLRKEYGHPKPWGVKYWGLGNESWGCGGNMPPEYYAFLARRYGTFMHTYGKFRPFKIAVGPGGDDYHWTNVVMKMDGPYINGLSLHYYSWANQRTATDFNEAGWADIMKQTLAMNTLIEKHSAIMDKYDPNKRIELAVDEYGTWYKVQPGTNPHFLYQQNTMRDAVAAACNLNIFNNHCDRVGMACIAQMVNVLQSMILTKGDKMIVTPTYWVFDMYKVHQNAMMVPVNVTSSKYIFAGDTLPAINCSASIDSTGKMHISLCNIDPDTSENVVLSLEGFKADKATGRVLTADRMNAHNTFEDPNAVKPAAFSGFKVDGNNMKVTMPPMSVVVLEIDGRIKVNQPSLMNLTNPKPGVDYDYYEVATDRLPSFADLTPTSSGTIDNFVLPKIVRDENFALKYDGYIKIPQDGLYTFYTTSDDGSAILIDGKLVVDNDGAHGMVEKSGNVVLSAGYHKIELQFFQGGDGMGLRASIKGPHMKKEIIPTAMLFRIR